MRLAAVLVAVERFAGAARFAGAFAFGAAFFAEVAFLVTAILSPFTLSHVSLDNPSVAMMPGWILALQSKAYLNKRACANEKIVRLQNSS